MATRANDNIRDLVGSVARTVLELKDWQKATLQPSERRTVHFDVSEEMPRFYTKDMIFASEPGDFTVYVGPNSAELQKAEFTLE